MRWWYTLNNTTPTYLTAQILCDNRGRRNRAASLLLAAARIPTALRARLERCTLGADPPLYLKPGDAPGVVDAIASFEVHQDAFRGIIMRRFLARRVRHMELAVEYREKQDAWVAHVKGDRGQLEYVPFVDNDGFL